MALAVHRSSKMIPDFVLHRPETVADAMALAVRYGGQAAFMAGGVSLINGMKLGKGAGNVIHLARLPGFSAITREAGRLQIGAGVTLWQLQNAPELDALPPAVRQAVTLIGNVRVRVKGTLGGNIMAREANYDVLPIMMALGAELGFASIDGVTRQAAVAALPADRLLMDLSVPVGGTWFGYDRTMRPFIVMAVGIEPGQAIRGGHSLRLSTSLWRDYSYHRHDGGGAGRGGRRFGAGLGGGAAGSAERRHRLWPLPPPHGRGVAAAADRILRARRGAQLNGVPCRRPANRSPSR